MVICQLCEWMPDVQKFYYLWEFAAWPTWWLEQGTWLPVAYRRRPALVHNAHYVPHTLDCGCGTCRTFNRYLFLRSLLALEGD